MRTLRIIRTLEFYDVPQLFVAVDAVGIKYLCLHYDIDEDGVLLYISVQLSDDRLNDFIKGHIDLRDLYVMPEQDGSLFLVKYDNDIVSAQLYKNELSAEMLPEEGYFFNDSSDEDAEMIERSIQTNSPIIRLAFETPDNKHDIEARCLSAALLSFQSLVDSGFKKLYKGENANYSTLQVTTFIAASFDVEFRANEQLDLFGQSKLGTTLDVINKLFSDDDSIVVETLRSLKGFAAANFRRFLDVLLAYNLAVNYKWVYSALESDVRKRKVTTPRLQSLFSIINSNSELGIEEHVFSGYFTAASIYNGKWTFNPDMGKEIKGDCTDKQVLFGITLADKRYRITCAASQSINDTTLKEKTKYTLVKCESDKER